MKKKPPQEATVIMQSLISQLSKRRWAESLRVASFSWATSPTALVFTQVTVEWSGPIACLSARIWEPCFGRCKSPFKSTTCDRIVSEKYDKTQTIEELPSIYINFPSCLRCCCWNARAVELAPTCQCYSQVHVDRRWAKEQAGIVLDKIDCAKSKT
jgi:hypothetical protein